MSGYNQFVKYLDSTIAKIVGTDGNDNIILNCSASTALCNLTVNDSQCSFPTSDIKPYGMIIDSMAGNDVIKVDMDKVYAMGMSILAEKGLNDLSISLSAPMAAAEVWLGLEANTLRIDAAKPTNSIIMGIRENKDSSIIITNSKSPDFEVQQSSIDVKVIDLIVDNKTMGRFYGGYTDHEMGVVAMANVHRDKGMPVPQEFIDLGLSSEHPPLLEKGDFTNIITFE
jgi:hypothetical protein